MSGMERINLSADLFMTVDSVKKKQKNVLPNDEELTDLRAITDHCGAGESTGLLG